MAREMKSACLLARHSEGVEDEEERERNENGVGGQLKSDQHWLGCQSLQVRRGKEVAT